jgi:hypothetical protein
MELPIQSAGDEVRWPMAFHPKTATKTIDCSRLLSHDQVKNGEFDADINREDLQKIADWLENFIAKPSELRGKQGPVCPFMPGCFRLKLAFYKIVRGNLSESDMEDIIEASFTEFCELDPKTGPKSIYKTLVFHFPDVTKDELEVMATKVQRKLKPRFVPKGFMIGDFGPNNSETGLYSKTFFPFRSPLPFIAIRSLTKEDFIFMHQEKDAENQVGLVKTFMNRFGRTTDMEVTENELTKLYTSKNQAESWKMTKQIVLPGVFLASLLILGKVAKAA